MPVITHVHCVLQYTCPANACVLFPSFGLDACQTQHETRGLHLPTDWKHEWIKTAHDSVPYIFCLPLLSRFSFFPCFSYNSASSPPQRHLSHSQIITVFSCFFHLYIVYIYFCPIRTILSLVFILLILYYIDTGLYIFRFNIYDLYIPLYLRQSLI